MKHTILVLASAVALLSSCSTAYKSGQTPDDLYYSPAPAPPAEEEYVSAERNERRSYRNSDDREYDRERYYDNNYRDYGYYEDRFIRYRVMNRYRWSALDNYYFFSPWSYNIYSPGFGYSFYNNWYSHWNNPWNSYYTWNSFYNPYYAGGFYGGGFYGNGLGYGNYYSYNNHYDRPARTYRTPNRPVVFNPNSYNVRPRGNDFNIRSTNVPNNRRYNNSNTNYNSGRNGSVNNNSYNNSRSENTPSRTYSPSNNSSNSGSGNSNSGRSNSGSSRPPR